MHLFLAPLRLGQTEHGGHLFAFAWSRDFSSSPVAWRADSCELSRMAQRKRIAMKNRTRLIVWKLVLQFASILAFRSLWLLLDELKWAGTTTGLLGARAGRFTMLPHNKSD